MRRRLRRWRVCVRTRKIESFSFYSSCINCICSNEIVTDVCWLRNKPFNSRAFCMALTNDRRITEAQQIRTTCISQFSQCRDACRDSPFKQIDSDLRLCRVNSIVLAAKLFWLYHKTIRSLALLLSRSLLVAQTHLQCAHRWLRHATLFRRSKRDTYHSMTIFDTFSFYTRSIRVRFVVCLPFLVSRVSSICRVCAHCTGGQHLWMPFRLLLLHRLQSRSSSQMFDFYFAHTTNGEAHDIDITSSECATLISFANRVLFIVCITILHVRRGAHVCTWWAHDVVLDDWKQNTSPACFSL